MKKTTERLLVHSIRFCQIVGVALVIVGVILYQRAEYQGSAEAANRMNRWSLWISIASTQFNGLWVLGCGIQCLCRKRDQAN